MTWTVPFPHPVDGPTGGPERPLLEGYLDWQRATAVNVCAGLDAEQLARRPLPSTTLSLLGLLRHLAKVERVWFRIRAAGQDVPMLYPLGRDDDFDLGTPADAEAAVATLVEEQDLARRAAAALPFDRPVPAREEFLSLRMVHVHVIGEYARHNGHADLLREAIDGVTGR